MKLNHINVLDKDIHVHLFLGPVYLHTRRVVGIHRQWWGDGGEGHQHLQVLRGPAAAVRCVRQGDTAREAIQGGSAQNLIMSHVYIPLNITENI